MNDGQAQATTTTTTTTQQEHNHTKQEQPLTDEPPSHTSSLKRQREEEAQTGSGEHAAENHTDAGINNGNGNDDHAEEPREKKIKLDPASNTTTAVATAAEETAQTSETTTSAPTSITSDEASDKSSTAQKLAKSALLEKLKGIVKKTDNIIQSNISSQKQKQTPSASRRTGRQRKSRSTEESEEFEPESESASQPASRERRSRRSRKSNIAEDTYDLAEDASKTLVGPFRTCYDILQQIKKHRWAWPFAEPVDVEGLGITDYYLIIKKPMDLGTVQNKLISGQYASVYDFAEDMNLIWDNCMTYNQPGTDVVKMALSLKKVFQEKFKKVVDEVESPGSASTKLKEMQARSQEMEDKIARLSAVPPGGQYQLEGLPEGMIATPAPPVSSSSSKSGRNTRGRTTRRSTGGGARGRISTQRKPSKPSTEPEKDVKPMSFEEKKELSELIGQLNNDQLTQVVDIIQRHAPRDKYANQTETEIEIDLDQLNSLTLRALEQFAKESLGLPMTKKNASNRKKPATKRSSVSGRGRSTGKKGDQDIYGDEVKRSQHDTDEETDDDSSSSESSGDELDSDSDDENKNGPQSLSAAQAPKQSSTANRSVDSASSSTPTLTTQPETAKNETDDTIQKLEDLDKVPSIITHMVSPDVDEKVDLQNENMWSATFSESDDEMMDNKSEPQENDKLWSSFQQTKQRERELEEQRKREAERKRREQEEEHQRKLREKEREEQEAREQLEEEREREKRKREEFSMSQKLKEQEEMEFDEQSFEGGSFFF